MPLQKSHQILTQTFEKPERYSKEQIERAKKRLSDIGDKKPTWSEIELKMEMEHLKEVIASENYFHCANQELGTKKCSEQCNECSDIQTHLEK